MQEFLSTPTAKAILWIAVLLIILAGAYYLMRRFRDRIGGDRQSASELLTNFREMRHEGDIDESEFRTIKTVLGQKLQEELRNRENDDSTHQG